jgi:enterobactin synthetase component D
VTTEVRSPSIVPSFASHVTVTLDPRVPAAASVPPELHRATPDRKRQYLAGRYCADHAVERLRPSATRPAIGRGAAGEPQWPAGLTGSVTHTDGLASAAVARLTDARSIGIDSEMRVDHWRAERIRPLVMRPEEHGVGGRAIDEATRVTLVFSAKESIFKCLYPVIGRRFYYEDALITSGDPATGQFVAELMTTLAPGFERGTILRGRFEIDDARVHTGVWLDPHVDG